jgi:hypothetical protein
VIVESLATGHKRYARRLRVDGKLEQIMWDPLVRQEVLYRELKKLRTLKS